MVKAGESGSAGINLAGNHESNRDFEETNSKLAQGLKTCRKVVNTYRALLSSAPNEDLPREDAAVSLENSATIPETPDLAGG